MVDCDASDYGVGEVLSQVQEAVDFHQRMLNYSRRDLVSLGEVVKEMVELSGSDLRDPDLGMGTTDVAHLHPFPSTGCDAPTPSPSHPPFVNR